MGSKAKYELNGEQNELTCFTHHISEYITVANNRGYKIITITEYFDNDNSEIPRIINFLFQRI